MGDLVCFFGLPRDLRFADHHRIEGRGYSKEMADRRPSKMDIEVVVFRQLTLAVGQIGEIAAKVEEQGVGMDSRFSAKVELDAVAGPEVDELGETCKPSELDQVFARKVGRQGGRRELVDMNGTIRGADDADTIQIQCLPAGFYDTTWRNSVTEG